MSLMHKKVGDTVYVFGEANGSHKGRGGFVAEVTKVGRENFYIQKYGRSLGFCRETGRQKNDRYMHLKAWDSEQERARWAETRHAWMQLSLSISGGMPKHMTLETIQKIKALIDGSAS